MNIFPKSNLDNLVKETFLKKMEKDDQDKIDRIPSGLETELIKNIQNIVEKIDNANRELGVNLPDFEIKNILKKALENIARSI